jgi:23S rRNA U2552 (ribose-2'-O)-methylase RlmE/FtsJ
MATELLELCKTNLYDTDKFSTNNTIAKWIEVKHSYVESVYGELFKRIRLTKNVLEIGIWNGGSHLLWRDYFPEANIVGIDIKHCAALDNQSRIVQIIADAYTEQTSNLFKDDFFDLIIDDGPHTLESIKLAIQYYLPKLSENGMMCIEDIDEYSWLYQLSSIVPPEMQKCIKVFDLREKDKKKDSTLMVIDKGELNG